MRHLTVSILVTLAVLLGSAGEGFALPSCPADRPVRIWSDCFGIWTINSGDWAGDKYVGAFRNGKYNGQGTYYFLADNEFKGDTYVGEFKDGKKHGQGTLTFASGAKYVGEWKDGNKHGQGTLTFADGFKYVGEWKDDKEHGQGTFTFGSKSKWAGDKYVGEYKDGKSHGQGTYTYADGRVEEGIWENGFFKYAQKVSPTVTAKKTPPPTKGKSFALPECPGTYNKTTWTNCEGTETFASGGKYVGEYKDGFPHGQGTETFANGDKYVGEFKGGNRHGQGTYTSAGGDKYVGEWKGGKSHGQGTYTFADGDKYVGEHKDDNPHGQGTYTFADGQKYVGEHKDGKKHGQGTATYTNGNKYVGEFKDGRKHGQGTFTFADGRVEEGISENGEFKAVTVYAQKVTPTVTAKKSPEPSSQVQNENERLRKKIARLEKEKKQKPKPAKQVAKRTPPKPSPPPPKSATSGSGFFISKKGHVITNQHIVNKCKEVTVGDNAQKQVTADVLETDRSNDLALLRISSTKMASADTKSLISKLGITVVPLASDGLLRSEDVELGERVLVAGYPYGDIFSNTIKVTGGMVSANRGFGDDTGQFQMDAAVQPGNSGGPIYDENGNIVGVVVSQLNKMKFAKATGSMPENVNFGIKASTVRQFLNSAGLPTKWSKRSKRMSTKQLAKIAKNQTVMVVCHP